MVVRGEPVVGSSACVVSFFSAKGFTWPRQRRFFSEGRRERGYFWIREANFWKALSQRDSSSGSKAAMGKESRMVWRSSGREWSAPEARAWMRRLPAAVASAGPARTLRRVALAANWLSRELLLPPPTMWRV